MPNRATREVRQFCEQLIADPQYRANFEQRWRSGTLPPQLEAMVWSYAAGRPPQSVELTTRGISLAELICGTIPNEPNDEDSDGDEPVGSRPSDVGQ